MRIAASSDLDIEATRSRTSSQWEARDPDGIVALHTEDSQFLGRTPAVDR